jgi:1-acyl-sn-glycerol-3-phosphate acyltransferase
MPAPRKRNTAVTGTGIGAARALLEPWRVLTAPKFYGIDAVPNDRPILLVGNHTLMGVLDVPLLIFELYERRGVFARALGDHAHFQVPLWRDLLSRFGTVDGTRDNCRALMRAGESILVFPGGGREVFKRKGEKYQLIWKNRLGFARLAIERGYTIVPFSAVGADDCYDIVFDKDDLDRLAIGRLLDRLSPRAELTPPVVRGLAGTVLPRPQRFYFRFGKPIGTTRLRGKQDDDAVCERLRDRVRAAVEAGIRFLLRERERDPKRDLGPRLAGELARFARPRARLRQTRRR